MESVSITLSPWQKKQAALLYYFASLDYLKSVKMRIDSLFGLPGETLGNAAAGKHPAGRRSKRRRKPAPDSTMSRLGLAGRWTDFGLTIAGKENADAFRQSPKFDVREDVFADSGLVTMIPACVRMGFLTTA